MKEHSFKNENPWTKMWNREKKPGKKRNLEEKERNRREKKNSGLVMKSTIIVPQGPHMCMMSPILFDIYTRRILFDIYTRRSESRRIPPIPLALTRVPPTVLDLG